MAFVKFTEVGKSFSARVSISERGMISFNQGARHKFNMDRFGYCILYYDEEENWIGVELTDDKEAEGAIRLRKRATGADLGAKSFLFYFDIVPDKTSMYEIKAGEKDNWINIDLKTKKERGKRKDKIEN